MKKGSSILDRQEKNEDLGTTLIIGGSGYVGSRIAKAEAAKKSSSQVVIFDSAPPTPAQGLDSMKFLKGSILNQGELIEAIKKENISKIVHTSYIYSGEAKDRPAEAAKYNFLGTVNVLELLKTSRCAEDNLFERWRYLRQSRSERVGYRGFSENSTRLLRRDKAFKRKLWPFVQRYLRTLVYGTANDGSLQPRP
jgi:dTDP-D-glucose 4,6-dehydratase